MLLNFEIQNRVTETSNNILELSTYLFVTVYYVASCDCKLINVKELTTDSQSGKLKSLLDRGNFF